MVAGLTLVSATLNLIDFDASVFSSDAIPAALPLSEFGFARASIGFEGGVTRRVAGNVTSLTLTVPEPGAALLVLGGLALARATGRTPPASSPSPARTRS